MQTKIDFDKEYGIVLEGGGAKGAYQIGVWKAFIEYGVKIKGISGVSVGALNGALMCMGDYDRAMSLWENITYSQIMNVDDDKMDNLIKRNFNNITFNDLRKDTVKILGDGGFDVTPLKELIEDHINEEKIRNSPIDFIISTFSITQRKELDLNVKEIEPGLICDYLLGSAYFPAFKIEKLHGKKYIDGGVVNNLPIDHLINRGYKDIIVIRIFGIGLEKNIKIPEDVNIIEIAPRVNLGNLLEFDCKKSKRNIKIGYYDGLRCMRNLEGKRYYIDGTHTQDYYVNMLTRINQETIISLCESYQIKIADESLYYRYLFEDIFPLIAKDLKLTKTWSYKELYLSMLELCAKSLKIQKYRIYQEDELHMLVCESYKIVNTQAFLGDSLLNNISKIIINLMVDKITK